MASKNPYEHLVKKNQWDKINAKINKANLQTKLEIAEACGNSGEDESMNILIRFLSDSDPAVQLQAVKSLGSSARPMAKTHLTWLAGRVPESNVELRQAIRDAAAAITKRAESDTQGVNLPSCYKIACLYAGGHGVPAFQIISSPSNIAFYFNMMYNLSTLTW